MNKYDLILILTLIFISSFMFSFFKEEEYAKVYYDNKLILTIDLKKDNTYEVDGYNGKVKMRVKNNKLKVIEENSTYHICSKQSYTNKGTIVCLPNKIIIEFQSDKLDTVVG